MGSNFSMLHTSDSSIDGLGLRPPKSYDINPSPESKRKLDFYLKGNHFSYGFLFNDRKFHNHLPHALISAYYLGASPKQLTDIYDDTIQSLVPWKEDSPSEVTDDDWTEFFGRKDYEKAYFDYFTDQISDSKYDWKHVVRTYLVDKYESDDLLQGLYGGLVHPLIHLGYAVEVDSPLIGIEALAMACTEYSDFNKLLKETGGGGDGDSDTSSVADPIVILNEIRNDSAFDNHSQRPFELPLQELIEKFSSKINYYSDRLDVSNFNEAIKQLLNCGVLLLTTTHKDDDPIFDFFLLHILTSGQELAEIILSKSGIFPEKFHSLLIKQLWTITVVLYISQLRPLIKPERIPASETAIDQIWKDTIDKALNGPKRYDSHFIKAIRAMLVSELLLQDKTGIYARAANHFAANHSEYTGRTLSKRLLDVKL